MIELGGALVAWAAVADDARAAGRALLAELVAAAARTGGGAVDASAVRFAARCPDCGGLHGRLEVMAPAAAREVRVSCSYAGDRVYLAAALGRAVGIDAEPAGVEPAGGAASLADWTAIEAVLKADGRGLRVDPAGVRVTADRREAAVDGGARRYALHPVEAPAGDVVTLAVAPAR